MYEGVECRTKPVAGNSSGNPESIARSTALLSHLFGSLHNKQVEVGINNNNWL